MAKGKDGGKGKTKKVKVPKYVGRVKVSKKLREAGEKAWKLADQPIVSEVAAAAMLAAASALHGKAGKGAVGKAAAAGEGGTEARKFADSLRELAIDLARRTIDSWEQNHGQDKGGAGKRRKGAGKGKSA